MFELMYDAKGIGLAANQVQYTTPVVRNQHNCGPKSKRQRRVFINPVLDSPKGKSEAEEGCLSIPGVFGIVSRPSHIHVSAFDLAGNTISNFVAEGLLGRAIQHEYDHIDGVLFIDRLSESTQRQINSEWRRSARF